MRPLPLTARCLRVCLRCPALLLDRNAPVANRTPPLVAWDPTVCTPKQKARDKEAHEATGEHCEHGVWRCRCGWAGLGWVGAQAAKFVNVRA